MPRHIITDVDRKKSAETRRADYAAIRAFKAKVGRFRKLSEQFGSNVALGVLAHESVQGDLAADRIRAAQAYLRESREPEGMNTEQRSKLIDETIGLDGEEQPS